MIAALKRQPVNKVPGSNRNSLCGFCEAAVSPQTVLWHFCTQLTELFYSSRVAQLRLHLLALTTGINVSQLFCFFFLLHLLQVMKHTFPLKVLSCHKAWNKKKTLQTLEVLNYILPFYCPLHLTCSAASGSRWVSSRGTVNCIFLGLPVSMVALSVKEEDRANRRRRRRRRRRKRRYDPSEENPLEKKRMKSSVMMVEKENKWAPA